MSTRHYRRFRGMGLFYEFDTREGDMNRVSRGRFWMVRSLRNSPKWGPQLTEAAKQSETVIQRGAGEGMPRLAASETFIFLDFCPAAVASFQAVRDDGTKTYVG